MTRVIELLRVWHRWQIPCRTPVHGTERRPVAHQKCPGTIRKKEALVRVERERICAVETTEQSSEVTAREEETTVGAIHVMPELLANGAYGGRDGVRVGRRHLP